MIQNNGEKKVWGNCSDVRFYKECEIYATVGRPRFYWWIPV